MNALTQDRNTPQALGDFRSGGVGSGQTIYAGALICRNAAGFLVKGVTATGLVGVGRAEERVHNSGDNGDVAVRYRPGIFKYSSASGADAITITEIGKLCYVVDDQTVAKTDGGGTRSKAGIVEQIDNSGTWVRFDEALTRAA